MFENIRADLARIGKPTLTSGLKWYFVPRGECFPYNVWLRALQWCRRHCRFLAVLVYPIYRHYEFKYGIHANANTEIGGGLRVVHGPCNLNAARIGKDFTVYSGVTIGTHRGGIPSIGDEVSIFPNAVVCGPISIGGGAVIGALTYVSHDVPAGVKIHA